MPTPVIFVAKSKFGKKIRLTKNIWFHKILKSHPELGAREEYVEQVKKTLEDPDYIVSGWFGEYLALRFCEIAPRRPKYLCVVYRELNDEGFIITAFFISNLRKLLRRGVLWRKR